MPQPYWERLFFLFYTSIYIVEVYWLASKASNSKFKGSNFGKGTLEKYVGNVWVYREGERRGFYNFNISWKDIW
jgi:hypothetical protein